jgi:putative ABC transport system permease protein
LRRFLIVIETALAVVLLSGAGLLAASWVNLQSVDPGFEIAGVQAVEVGVADALPEPDSRIGYFERLLAEAESVPGVESVSIVSTLPLNGYTVWSPGIFRGSADSTPVAGLDCLVTGPGYFETMGIQIISGRGFTAREDISGGGLAVISEKAAQRMWPGEAPLGRQFFLGSPENPPITVVGVVADVHTIGLASDPFGAVYLAHSQVPSPPFMYLVVRSARGGRDLGVELKSIMQRLNSKIPFEGLVSLRDRVSDSVNRPRFNALLLVLFAGTALLLAAVGVSATLLNSVTQRTREIGVRVALGATSSKVLQMVIREGLILTGLGLAIGLAGTYALSRLLASFLFGVSATDPLILAAVCTALGAVAAVACYLPARHAMRMDPVHALRAE